MSTLHSVNPAAAQRSFRRVWFSPGPQCGVCSPQLRDWLLDQGSLTARLQVLSRGQLRVRILAQYWGRAQLSECEVLGLAQREQVLIREVVLQGCGKNWVYARSILPRRSLTGALRRLRSLEDRPLGGWLFRQPGLRRGPLQLSRYACGDSRLQTLMDAAGAGTTSEPLMGRRSVFYVDHKPILVGEVFLPALVARLEGRGSMVEGTIA